MKIKQRTTLILGSSILLTVIVTFVIVYQIFGKYLNNNEVKSINASFQSIISILNKEKDGIEGTCQDYAKWDETYNFLINNNSNYLDNNFFDNNIENLWLNLIVFTDVKGNVRYQKDYNLGNEPLNAESNELINGAPDNFRKLITFQNNDESHTGIVFLNGKLFIIVALPVTSTDCKAKSNGSLIMGKYLDEEFFGYLMNVVHDKVEFKQKNVSDTVQGDNNGILDKDFTAISALNELDDVFGNKTVAAYITMERDEYSNGIYALKVFVGTFLSLILLVTLFDVFILNKYLIKRIKILHEFMEYVAKQKHSGVRVEVFGNDEIADLANSTNKMLTELEDAYNDILFLSYSDKLTGLRNRSFIEKRFEEVDKDKLLNYAIIMGDLNGLKLTNDTFGHKEGDKLIITISKILQKSCENDDIVARWGGDEFVILILNKGSAYINKVINKVKLACYNATDLKFKFNIALGSAEVTDTFISTEELMKIAEERMYHNKLLENKSFRSESISSLKDSLHEKHNETKEHTTRIKDLCVQFGYKLGLSKEEIDKLELLGSFHDIGKIGISDQILTNPENLNDEEWQVMKTHTEIGFRMAKASQGLANIAEEILYHHERFDGTGYPKGLKGHDIPLLSRILNIVDSFDVMTHRRSYKGALSYEVAIKELKKCSGSQFDPELVLVFLAVLAEEEIVINQ